MKSFEGLRLYNPEFTCENRLPPRATVIPALHKGVFYKNRLESELITDLNGDYKFIYRDSDDRKDFFSTELSDGDWDTLPVPSMWQYHGYGSPVYTNTEYPIPLVPPYVGDINPVGYYRKRFNAKRGGRKILYFGGVDCAFFAYLNGEYVGFSKGSRIPAEFDVTHLIREGENLLCVKVFTYSDGTYLENQDMLLASGIFRDVMLYDLGNTYLWDYCIRTEGDAVLVDLEVKGECDNATVKVSLEGQSQSAKACESNAFRFDVKDPIRWNAETPHTYEVTIELFEGDRTLEIHTKKIGFAQFEVSDDILKLNGRQITLKGINRHEHDPKNGRAVTVELIERELKLIKSHNMNAIRCSHYPNNPAFYEICTELGIYVMNEADIETHGAQVGGDMGYFSKHPLWYKAYFDRVSRMYERDKNETCISIWTIGNENGDGENIYKCMAYLRSRSVKKPVMNTGNSGPAPEPSDFRIIGYFPMASLTGAPREGKPLLMLEYGHAMGNSPGLMQDTWDYVYRNRHVCGGYVWEFKNHGFYAEDENGTPFYKYGGDFENDVNHWSNFTMDGYCLSDGTPKPSLRECKNVLAPTYVFSEDGKIYLMNTNDFRPLDYVTLKWEICEDYSIKKCGEMTLPDLAPYETAALDLDTEIEEPIAGAEYFANLRFYDENGYEIAYKQVSLGVKIPKEKFTAAKAEIRIDESDDEVRLFNESIEVKITKGLLSYVKKGESLILEEPMQLNLYRAPTDNDGITNFRERWIADWNMRLYRHFRFSFLTQEVSKLENGSVLVRITGKWAPISKFIGVNIDIEYTVCGDGNIFVNIHGIPFGIFAQTLPRLGVVFTLDKKLDEALWYGRGKEECYSDRRDHCNFGLYRSTVSEMNFMYDVPQECGTRVDTHFLRIGNGKDSLSVVGSDTFAFSYHDFTLSDLIAARHRNELKKSDKNYLYIDYAMRGLGSKSCGPDPEECYELRPHEFRFAFMLANCTDKNELLALSRKRFDAVCEKLSGTISHEIKFSHINVVECDVD